MRQFATILIAALLASALAAASAQAQRLKRIFTGQAAYYDVGYNGRMASGAPYDPAKFTAAHRTLPFGTRLRVTNLRSGRSVIVTVTDRGPFNAGRVIDLSLAAAKALNFVSRGLVEVRVEVL